MISVFLVNFSQSFQYRGVTRGFFGQAPRNTTNRGDADACFVSDLSVGKSLCKQFSDSPSVFHGLQLRRGAQVLKEGATFSHVPQVKDGIK